MREKKRCPRYPDYPVEGANIGPIPVIDVLVALFLLNDVKYIIIKRRSVDVIPDKIIFRNEWHIKPGNNLDINCHVGQYQKY